MTIAKQTIDMTKPRLVHQRRETLGVILRHRHLGLGLALLGILVTLPSLWAGLLFDDYHHKLVMQGSNSPVQLLRSQWDLFRLIDSQAHHTLALVDWGLLPWWTDETIRFAFWRPAASLTHWLDYALWPQTPALMHAQSILWYALLVAAATLLYRRYMGLTVAAGLAAVLYCVDDSHSVPVGLLANRNATLAALFGVLALICHERWRRGNWRGGAIGGPILLAISLLAKEEGIGTCAYLVAFAVFLDEAPWRRRLASLLPYLGVVTAWRLCWSSLGYGVANVGPYVDPLRETGQFLIVSARHAPMLLLGQLLAPAADLDFVLEGRWEMVYGLTAAILVAIILVTWIPLVRRDRMARFWLVGMLLALLPISTTFASNRMLMFVGIGGMALVAQFLMFVFGDADRSGRRLWRIPAFLLAGALAFVHLIVCPVNLAIHEAAPMAPTKILDKLYLSKPLDQGVEQQDLVFVNAPAAFFLMNSPLIWASGGEPMPRRMRLLAASMNQPVDVFRPDEKTLVVRPAAGFLTWKGDRLFRSDNRPLLPGQQVHLTGMTATITAISPDTQRPVEVSFRFATALEDPSLRWLAYEQCRFVPFIPPAVGESMTLQGSSWWDLIQGP